MNYLEQQRNTIYWHPKDKRPIRLKDMETNHIKNTIKVLEKSEFKVIKAYPKYQWLRFFTDELHYRNKLAQIIVKETPILNKLINKNIKYGN